MTRKDVEISVKKSHEESLKIIQMKSADYAKDSDAFLNYRQSEIVGVPMERSMLSRIVEKIIRVSNLLDKENETKDESITDALIDISNISLLLKAHLENKLQNAAKKENK